MIKLIHHYLVAYNNDSFSQITITNVNLAQSISTINGVPLAPIGSHMFHHSVDNNRMSLSGVIARQLFLCNAARYQHRYRLSLFLRQNAHFSVIAAHFNAYFKILPSDEGKKKRLLDSTNFLFVHRF